MLVETARSQVRTVVPEAFNLRGQSIGTAGLLALGVTCDRTLDNETVFGGASFFWTAAIVQPVNKSWEEGDFIDHYVLDFVTDAPGVRASLARRGIAIDQGTIVVSKKLDVPGQGNVWEWTVSAEAMQALFHNRLNSEDPQVAHEQIHLWFGTERFGRVRANLTLTVDSLITAGDLLLSGSSRMQQAMAKPASPWVGSTYTDERWEIELEPEYFEE